ncbi:ubiquitin family protein, partial [Cooperia oncophora]
MTKSSVDDHCYTWGSDPDQIRFQAKILVSSMCRVSEVKTHVSEVTDVLPDKIILLYKGVELKNDNLPIRKYGIKDDCELIMSVKNEYWQPSNAVLYVPPSFPEGSVGELRNRIKAMTNIRQKVTTVPKIYRKIKYKVDKKHTEWTPEKQMEHEITRNKMK